MKRPSTLVALSLSGLVSGLVACGGGDAKPPVTKPVVAEPKVAPVDASPVAAPAGLAAEGHATSAKVFFDVARDWFGAPIPPPAKLARDTTGADVGDVIDPATPIDFAIQMEEGQLVPAYAFATTLKAGVDPKVAFAKVFTAKAGENGATLFEKKAEGSDEDEGPSSSRVCLTWQAKVSDATRLVCGSPAGVKSLAPYLLRTLSTKAVASDLHIDVFVKEIQKPIKMGLNLAKGQMPPTLGDAIGEFGQLIGDVGKLSIDGKIAGDRIDGDLKLTFISAESKGGKAFVDSQSRTAAAPSAFFKLPADVDAAFYTQGVGDGTFLDQLLAKRPGLNDVFKGKVKDLLKKPLVIGHGMDLAASKTALDAAEAVKDQAKQIDADAKAESVFEGYFVVRFDEKSETVKSLFDESIKIAAEDRKKAEKEAAAKDKERKGAKDEGWHPPPPPVEKVTTSAATFGLPKGTIHYVRTSTVTVDQPRAFAEPAVETKKGAKPAKPPAAKPPVKVTTEKHIFLVPDGSATWTYVGSDAKALSETAKKVLGSEKPLSARAGIELVSTGVANSAGFLTPKFFTVLGAGRMHGGRHHGEHHGFGNLLTMVSRPNADTPIPLAVRANKPEAGAPIGVYQLVVQLPKAAVEAFPKR